LRNALDKRFSGAILLVLTGKTGNAASPESKTEKGKKMKKSEKQQIRDYVRSQYAHLNGRNVRCHADGSVSVYVDEMPNTNQEGRVFAGWDTELLEAAKNA
jgi:hypothetical protein